ncbi:MAG: rhodanese-like domain-containing protein [Oscillospiraceae bacterium]|nr:rhodanese-like domain-containing protein [Oscillospiraceae bacterium]
MNNISLFFGCSVIAVMLLAVMIGCGKNDLSPEPQAFPPPSPAYDEDIIPPGGTEDRSDPAAAKSIASDEINSFECRVSLLSYLPEDIGVLKATRYEFSAVRTDKGAVCSFLAFPAEAVSFTQEEGFMESLQQIVSENDLAAFNGRDRTTYGLPDDFGAVLKIDYASGERIRAYDNSDMYLPLSAVEAFVTLFEGAVGPVPYTSISAEEALELMAGESDFMILDVRREDEFDSGHIPGAVLLPNEEIQLGQVDPLARKDQLLLLYCRTGRRSKEAAQKLSELGYTRVYEFGGIVDWPGEIASN